MSIREKIEKHYNKCKKKTNDQEVLELIDRLKMLNSIKKEDCSIIQWSTLRSDSVFKYEIAGYNIVNIQKARSFMDASSSYDARNWNVRVTAFYVIDDVHKLEEKIKAKS